MKQTQPMSKTSIGNLIAYCSKMQKENEPINTDEKIGLTAGITVGSQDILMNRWESKPLYPEDSIATKNFKIAYNKMSYLIICE
jgi:hypothetical protein